jgi:hypothetical protein
VEQHAGQVGSQRIEAGLAFIEHVQGSAVVGAMARFPDFPLDRGQQTFQPVGVDHVAGAGLHGPLQRGFFRGTGDQDQWQVEARVFYLPQHIRQRQRRYRGKVEHGIPRLVGKRRAQKVGAVDTVDFVQPAQHRPQPFHLGPGRGDDQQVQGLAGRRTGDHGRRRKE